VRNPGSMLALVCLLVWMLAAGREARAQPAAGDDPVAPVLATLQTVIEQGSVDPLRPLFSAEADSAAIQDFVTRWIGAGGMRVTMRERDRARDGDRLRVFAEALIEDATTGRLATWQIDLTMAGGPPRIVSLKSISSIEGLYRLSLDTTRQYAANDLRVVAEDFELTLAKGTVFMAQTAAGITALVLLGRGEMVFRPSPATERGQVRLFAGDDTLRTPFDVAYIRCHPSDLPSHVNSAAMQSVPVDSAALRDGVQVFRAEVSKSFSVELGDLSPDLWSLQPTIGDFAAEVRTRRFGTLTYARSSNEAEDISVFDRERRHNISIYASQGRLSARGPFFNEDDQSDYDVLDYNVDLSFAPERALFDGRARLKLRVRAFAISSLTLKLAASLAVRSVTSERYGRLLFLRVRNQDTLVVNLPVTLPRDEELTITVAYAGRVAPQPIDHEALETGQVFPHEDGPLTVPEPSYLYSNRSYWYPQTSITDYGTASIRLTLPKSFVAVCTGEPAAGSPVSIRSPTGETRQLFVFAASQPVRYLGCLVSRMVIGESKAVKIEPRVGGTTVSQGIAHYTELRLHSVSSPRQRSRGREMLSRATEIAQFYGSLLGDMPYPSFTLGVVESYVPGGHSPAYFAVLNSPLPTSPFTWRDDPASFDNFPEFFLAHELAHQWWGQGIGWKNYHEQWLSEGFAQYFAALYAEQSRGPGVFSAVIRSMSRWAVSMSGQGPVYLGYRLGHVRNDPRVMRALVYNKGAMVLHMLRRLTGDQPFFNALRRFYTEYRFRKTGTNELRRAFEAETGRDFTRFFDEWIYGPYLPTLTWSTRIDTTGPTKHVVVRFEQGERLFVFPVTVSVQLGDGTFRDVTVEIRDRVVEQRIPFHGTLRGIRVNRDKAALLRDES
jgi:hypothetical protein